ncbi:MAG: hypothetical protein ACOYUB_00555 [Patescibacteria group bacterium]
MAEVTADQIDIRPVKAKVAVEALTAAPKGEGKTMATHVRELGIGTVDAVGGREIPQGMKDNLFIALFDVKDASAVTDPQLKPLAQGLESIIATLKGNLDPSVTTPTELNAAIKTVIEQTPGWNDAFKKMSAAQQDEVIQSIREMGAASFGRRMMVEKIVISQETGNYKAAKTKYEDVKKQLTTRQTEMTAVDAQILAIGKDRAAVAADRQSQEREVTSLNSEMTRLQEQRSRLEQRIADREQSYIDAGKSGKALSDALAKDKSFQKWTKDAQDLEDKINDPTGLAKKIADAEARLKVLETQNQYFERADRLTTEIEDLTGKVSTAEADMINARTAFANNINELMKQLNGVMPEAAKEAMNKYKSRLEEANREKAVQDANDKADKAKKEGDMLARAEAEITKAFELRYLKTIREFRFAKLSKIDIQVIDEDALRADFQDALNPAIGTRGVMERILNIAGNGAGSGLSAETIAYLTNPANKAAVGKLVENMRIPIFKSISRKAVLHLDLPETTLRNMATSPDFVEAAKAAVADNAEIRKVIESVHGAKLGGSTSVTEALRKMPAGGLLGFILMILGIFGSGLFTAKP